MEDFMFVLKCLAATIVVVVLMQIKIGGHSVEASTLSWIHHSPIAKTLQDVAEGAVKVGKQAKEGAANLVGSNNEAPAEEQQASTGWFKIKTKHKRFNPPVEDDTTASKEDDRD